MPVVHSHSLDENAPARIVAHNHKFHAADIGQGETGLHIHFEILTDVDSLFNCSGGSNISSETLATVSISAPSLNDCELSYFVANLQPQRKNVEDHQAANGFAESLRLCAPWVALFGVCLR